MATLRFFSGGETYATYEAWVPAPLFKKDFTLTRKPTSATLTLTVAGLYRLRVNGEDISRGYLCPFFSNPDDVLYSESYEIGQLLSTGKNTVEVLLGNGCANPVGGEIWGIDRGSFRRAPALALSFQTQELAFDTSSMQVRDTGLLFDDLRCGCFFDNLREAGPFSWRDPVPVSAPRGVVRPNDCPPVTAKRRTPPVSVVPGSRREYRVRDAYRGKLHTAPTAAGVSPLAGGWIYDFGRNAAGLCELKIRGTPGQKIEMQYVEFLTEGMADPVNLDVYPDGCCQRDVYVCRGEGEETWTAPFTYHGFRYVYVTGITEAQATPSLLTALALSNLADETAGFACSDPLSEKIFRACLASDESNLVNNITDCPGREKNGWTGDAAISAEQMLLLLDCAQVYRQFLTNLRAAGKDGFYPSMVPSDDRVDDFPVWDSVLILAPYAVWKRTGELGIVRENAEAMAEHLRCRYAGRDERGIIERGLGDWLPVDKPAHYYDAPLGFCVTAVEVEACRMAAEMMRALGREEDAAEAEAIGRDLRAALRAEYVEGGTVTAGKTAAYRRPSYRVCQTSQVLGLAFGLFESDEIPAARELLLSLIHRAGDTFDVGFLGLRYLFRVLADMGEADLALRLIRRPEHPSYANMICRGATTIWERFAAPGERVGSHNHHFLCDVAAWYVRYALGLKPNPEGLDPDRVEISPCHLPALARARGYVKTPHGRVDITVENTAARCKVKVKTEGSVTLAFRGILPEDITLLSD